MSLRATPLAGAALVVAGLLPSCGEDFTALGPVTPESAMDVLSAGLTQIQNAPQTVPHSGLRDIELNYEIDGVVHAIHYEERIYTDGQGSFSIRPERVVAPVLDDVEGFLLDQRSRQGFFFRYRDFQIRDADRFFANYRVILAGELVQVAGRDCFEVTIQRLTGGGRVFVVAFDIVTGLVLRYVEVDADENVISSMEYRTFDPDPDFAGVAFHESQNSESRLDPQKQPAAELGFPLVMPTEVPDGFGLFELASVVDLDGRTWAKQTYTDGVEPIFFLHSRYEPPLFLPSNGSVPAERTDRIFAYSIGPLTVLQGSLGDQDVIAVGKLPAEELLGMVDSIP